MDPVEPIRRPNSKCNRQVVRPLQVHRCAVGATREGTLGSPPTSENASSTAVVHCKASLIAQPVLGPAQHREADEPAHSQLPPAILHRYRAPVYLSAVGVEDLSASPLAAILGETPDDSKTNEAPVFEITRAPDAAGIRIIRIGVVRVSELCGCHLDRAPGRRPQRGLLW